MDDSILIPARSDGGRLRVVAAMHDFTTGSGQDDDDDDDTSGVGGFGSPNNPFGSTFGNMNPYMAFNSGARSGLDDDDSVLEMLIDYNAKFASADAALFRDSVIRQTMAVLIGRNKANALLVGPAGTGKTRIVEDIARRIACADASVPPMLRKCRVYELPASNIVAGSSLVGQLEAKAKAVIEWAEDPANHAILFIDEIHQLVGHDQSYGQVAQILKPALARGNLRVIGATTLQEATRLLSDPAFNRRFSRIIVDELTPAQTIEIMRSMRGRFFTHYGQKVVIDDAAIEMVQRVADLHSEPGLHRPDNAVTLLDRSCADAFMDRMAQETELAAKDPNLLAMLQTSAPTISLTEKRVRKTAMLLMTGHAAHDQFDRASMESALAHVKGQNGAKERMLSMLHRRALELFGERRPLAVMMAGPSGVGKTEMARTIAAKLTGAKPIILNMTEYSDATSVNDIIGSADGFVGSDSNRELPFDSLQSNPYQVILLDEFEKAAPGVQRLFMSVLEDGELVTRRGAHLDFSHAIVLATTNAGAGRAAKREIGFGEQSGNSASKAASALSAWFDPELLNRFTDIIQFESIPRDVYRDILASQYAAEVARIIAARPKLAVCLPASLSNEELDAIVADTYVPEFGARPARRAVQAEIERRVLDSQSTTSQFASVAQTGADDDAADDVDDDAVATKPIADEDAAVPVIRPETDPLP